MIATDPMHDSWLGWVPWHPPAALPVRPSSADMPAEPLMSVQQLAAYLQVGNLWVYRRLKDGHIPHTRIGGVYRFSRQAIDAWLWH